MQSHTTLVFLHFLGGSGRTWAPVIAAVGSGVRSLTIDLPGFGDAASEPGSSVAEMVDAVAAQIRAAMPGSWLLVGHSMGAKIACVLARQMEDGAAGLEGLAGLVLIAGSPPSPEPMDDDKRTEMLGWFTDDAVASREQATGFIEANVSEALPPALKAGAVDDVLRADRARWRAWLTGGSTEDWSDRVGVLRTPALIVAGVNDPCLGPDAQAALMAPHFVEARMVTLADAKHLLPLERTREIAALIEERLT